jgi:monoamine oxidase
MKRMKKELAEHAEWPNPAESRLDYYGLLENEEPHFHAHAHGLKVAIVGAGVAGLTAARQLLGCGVGRISIFEASDRIGGRLWSMKAGAVQTPYELGAMRVPFFNPERLVNNAQGDRERVADEDKTNWNGALKFYVDKFRLKYQDFPSPGTSACNTGIWINDGYGPDLQVPYDFPRLDFWEAGGPPPHPIYKAIKQKWEAFRTMFRAAAAGCYENKDKDSWWRFWHAVAEHYWAMNFRDLVFAPRKATYTVPGDFGGLGMTEKEAGVFYVMGMGDGGWGAFYDISALWVLRTMMFGFADGLHLIRGKESPVPRELHASNGAPLQLNFCGIQSLAECLLAEKLLHKNVSLADSIEKNAGVELFLNKPVRRIERLKDDDPEAPKIGISFTEDAELEDRFKFHAAIVTTPTWLGQMAIKFLNFDSGELRRYASPALNRSHVIVSCKVFYPLKERFWESKSSEGPPIPQVICTDTFLQGAYGYAFDTDSKRDPGVLLASYTWEDDALKLQGIPPLELGERCLKHLDEIVEAGTPDKSGKKAIPFSRKSISECVDKSNPPVVKHWVQDPWYLGCSKLYRQRSWHNDYELLNFNSLHAAKTGVYFAGEAYSVEGGWIEPALRSAIDAVAFLARDVSRQEQRVPRIPAWCPACVEEPGR